MNQSLSSNIWKYAVFLITNKRVFVAIIAIYYLTIPGVDALGIAYILLAGNIAGVLFEIPSGYWADIIGHRKTLILSRVFAVISSLLYLISNNIWLLIFASIFLSLSVAFTSGTGAAFMRETMIALGRQNEYSKIMGRLKSLGFSLPLLISTFVPFLVKIDMTLPFLVGLLMDIVGLIIAFSFIEPTVKEKSVEVKELGLQNIVKVFVESQRIGFLKFSFYTGLLGGFIFAIGNYRGPYQQSFGIDIALFGIFFTAGRLFASVMLWFSGSIQKHFSMKQFFFFQTLLYSVIFLILGVTQNAWIAVILFAAQNGLKWGLTEIEESYFIHLIDKSSFKATILSIGAQVQQIVGGFSGLMVGYIITLFGYKKGFLVFGIFFTVVMMLAYLITFVISNNRLLKKQIS